VLHKLPAALLEAGEDIHQRPIGRPRTIRIVAGITPTGPQRLCWA
jgi:hypothetical protein